MPKYDSIKVFGCLCYPWLKPYAKNKLEPRSTPCVYLGFSNKHYCHQCFDPLTSKIYFSRDVLFLENQFPFENIFSHLKNTQNKNVSWEISSLNNNHSIILKVQMIFVSFLHRLCSSPWTRIHPSPLPQHVPLSQVIQFLPYLIILLLLRHLRCPLPSPYKIQSPTAVHHNQMFHPHQFILLPSYMLSRNPQLSLTSAEISPLDL